MKITTQLTSIALLTALSCSVASAANVTFDGAGGVVPYHVAGNWTGVVGGDGIPTAADDATVTGRFQLGDGTDRSLNSLTVNGGGSFIGDGSLNVTHDVLINSNLQLQGSGNLQWGGLATLGNGTGRDLLEVVFGTHTGSRVVGNNLDVTSSGLIKLRWYTPATEGSIVPEIDLSGALNFTAGSFFEVNLEGDSTGNALTEGTYFLIGSTNITGSATLSLIDFEVNQAASSFLSIVDTGDTATQGLYLTVIPEPGTYALLAGCFALASVMIRRRR